MENMRSKLLKMLSLAEWPDETSRRNSSGRMSSWKDRMDQVFLLSCHTRGHQRSCWLLRSLHTSLCPVPHGNVRFNCIGIISTGRNINLEKHLLDRVDCTRGRRYAM